MYAMSAEMPHVLYTSALQLFVEPVDGDLQQQTAPILLRMVNLDHIVELHVQMLFGIEN